MLNLARLQPLEVCGDGNCGYYACIASCNGKRALDHPASRRCPTVRDYEKQQKLRQACVGWLLHNDQLPFCLQEGGFLAKKECNEKGELVPCVPFVRDNTAIKRHLQGKSRNADARGVYANDALLRAMAATQGVFLVTSPQRN